MALRPTGPGDPRIPARLPPSGPPARIEPAGEAEPPRRAGPTPGRPLRVAVTDAEIEAQITRLMTLIANDSIDPDAPPGSYLNILL